MPNRVRSKRAPRGTDKTVSVYQALQKAGVTIESFSRREGDKVHGTMLTVRVKGFRYKGRDRHPWDSIPWLKSGVGSENCQGSGRYCFTISMNQLPEESATRLRKAFDKLEEAERIYEETVDAGDIAFERYAKSVNLDGMSRRASNARATALAVLRGRDDKGAK